MTTEDGFLLLCGRHDRIRALLEHTRLGRELLAQGLEAPPGDWQTLVIALDTKAIRWRMRLAGDLDVCFSGRIYSRPKETSAATVLRQTYSQYGTGAQQQINGEYAFALLDDESETVHAATDLFASRSLYYCQQGGVWAVSDCCAAVIALMQPLLQLNDSAICAFLVPFSATCLDRGDTFYAGLNCLRGGQWLQIDLRRGVAKVVQNEIPAHLLTDSRQNARQARERLLLALHDALADRVESNRAALALSGGIDSALIALALSDLRAEHPQLQLSALTSVLRGASGREEAHCAGLTAAALGIELQCLDRDPGPVRLPLTSPLPWAEQPMALCDDLSQVRALTGIATPGLSGMGSDELVATALRRPGRRQSLRGRLRRRLWWSLVGPFYGAFGNTAESTSDADLDGLLADRRPGWIHSDWHDQLPESELEDSAGTKQASDSGDKRDWTDLLLPNGGFRTDIEARDRIGLYRSDLSLPFLDHRVVRAMLSPAVAQADMDRWPSQPRKQFLRSILQSRLPRSVVRRNKTAAGQPVFDRYSGPEVLEQSKALREVPQLDRYVLIDKLARPRIDSPWGTLYPLLTCASLCAWFVHQTGVEEQWLITRTK